LAKRDPLIEEYGALFIAEAYVDLGADHAQTGWKGLSPTPYRLAYLGSIRHGTAARRAALPGSCCARSACRPGRPARSSAT
jgi:hypothetical protein